MFALKIKLCYTRAAIIVERGTVMGKHEKNIVEVVIAGEIVPLTGSESVEYIQRVAHYVDQKIIKMQQERKISNYNSFSKLLLISLNIADDYFKAQTYGQAAESALLEAEKELKALRTENAMLRDKVSIFEAESVRAKKELDAYISAFDMPAAAEPSQNVKTPQNKAIKFENRK